MNSSVRASFWGPNTQFGVVAFPEQRAVAEQRGWKVDGQEETCPTTGKKHIQFWVKTPQVRMSEVKKVFQGAHIEVGRNVKAVKNYCQKDQTRSGELPQASDKYPTQDQLFGLWAIRMRCRMRLSARSKWHIFWPTNGDQWLVAFDKICEDMIMDSYRVESLAVNPAVRSAIKKFGEAIYRRHISETPEEDVDDRCEVDRQTDRQPEIISQSVCIPTINAGSISIGNDAEARPSSDGASSESEDIEDDFGSTDERYTQGTGADSCEESDCTRDSE